MSVASIKPMGSRITILPIFLSLLLVLGSTSLIQMHNLFSEDTDTQLTSGRSVHYGDWVIHREISVADGCRSYSGSNYVITATNTLDMLAIYSEGCDDEYGDVIVYNTQDLSLIHTIQNNYALRDVIFSPDGQYLTLRSPEAFSIYETATWTEVKSQSRSTSDNFFFNSVTWSGDSSRVVVATGNNGGHMYEAPDWNEVEGTSSTGILVTHHPNDEKIWYVGSDGSGNVYEYQDVPLAGKRWVLTRSFTVQSPVYDLVASPDGDTLLTNDGTNTYVYSTADYTLIDTIEYTLGEAKFSHDESSLLLTVGFGYSSDDIGIFSTMDWDFEQDLDVYNGNSDATFSANDSEIFVLVSGGYDTTRLVGYMPDQDEDGVDDSRDQCPETPSGEESNTAGCSSSQRDTDGDGVNDKFDACPRTKGTSQVDANGCSVQQLLDSDGDGISDSDDVCPDSAINSVTDRNGCSPRQRDSDNDGFSDETDECPLDSSNECPENILWDFNGTQINNSKDYAYLEYAPNGDYIAARKSPSYGDIFVMDKNFSIVYTVYAPGDYYYNDFEWSPDSQELLMTISNYDSECEFQTWNVQTQVLSELQVFLSDCEGVILDSTTFSPDGEMIVMSTYGYGYTIRTTLMDHSMQSILLQDNGFAPDVYQFSLDSNWLFGGDGSQIIVWDSKNYEFVETRDMRGSDTMQLTSDGGHFLLHSDEEIMIYSASKLTRVTTTTVTETDSEITDIQFSKNQRLIYVTVLLEYCSWRCDGDEGATSILKTYSIDGGNLNLIAETGTYRSTNVVVPSYHPNEETVLIKPGRNEDFVSMNKDSDGDGLNNTIDICPDTNLTWEADENGCSSQQLDDDNDSIANFEDLCPDSPDGITTDEKGCNDQQVDEDFDGICNEDAQSDGPSDCVGEDKCPQSANGIAVDNNGCSWAQQDSDGDGVNNNDDVCEYTEIPGDADSNGCDRKQRDTDADSVNDYWDGCELTSLGDLTDENGCSDIQVDSDSDSVCNSEATSSGPSNCTSIDICPNTGANEVVDANGCSWNQKDDDGDSILNKFDQCPETLADSVAPNGCSTWQMDTDGDGVYDANDECANTEVGTIADSKGCSNQQNELNQASTEVESSTKTILALVGLILIVLTILIVLRRKNTEVFTEEATVEYPDYATRGAMMDGREWIEYPAGSQQRFYRDPSTQQWVHHK